LPSFVALPRAGAHVLKGLNEMKTYLTLLSLALCGAMVATAQAEPTLPVVTTAAKRPQAIDTALASVSVLTRADIERLQLQDSVTLLRQFAGVDVARTGGPGSSTSVFLRGTNSNHVLVLINGVRMASANTGAYAFEALPVEMIERIELVRGPLAALYGSDAIGGVLQIFTRTPETLSASVGVGRYDSFRSTASVGARSDTAGIGIALSRRGSKGFSSQNADGFSFDPDRDASYSASAVLSADATLGEALKLSSDVLRSEVDVEFDDGRSRLIHRQVGAQGAFEHSDSYAQTLRFGYANEVVDTPAFFSTFRSRRVQADWQHDLSFNGANADSDATKLSLGLNSAREKGSAGPQKSRTLLAPFVRLALPLGGHALEASARLDDDSQFGNHSSFSAAWGYQFETSRVFANIGQGFRAPNLNELYSPGFGGDFAGNAALNAERSTSAELGADITISAAKLGIRAYRTRIRELISFSGPRFSATNIAKAAIDGAELSIEAPLAGCTTRADLTLQNPRNLGSGQTLLRRAKRKLGAHANCDFDDFNLSLDGYGYSKRKDFGATLGGYGLLDAAISVPLGDAFSLQAKLENAFARDYDLAYGFNTPGRTWLVTLNWQGAKD
jgi:vitamin B12 transporter